MIKRVLSAVVGIAAAAVMIAAATHAVDFEQTTIEDGDGRYAIAAGAALVFLLCLYLLVAGLSAARWAKRHPAAELEYAEVPDPGVPADRLGATLANETEIAPNVTTQRRGPIVVTQPASVSNATTTGLGTGTSLFGVTTPTQRPSTADGLFGRRSPTRPVEPEPAPSGPPSISPEQAASPASHPADRPPEAPQPTTSLFGRAFAAPPATTPPAVDTRAPAGRPQEAPPATTSLFGREAATTRPAVAPPATEAPTPAPMPPAEPLGAPEPVRHPTPVRSAEPVPTAEPAGPPPAAESAPPTVDRGEPIALRDYHPADIDRTIDDHRRAAVDSLVASGTLSSAGPLTADDIRTMLFIALSSEQLRTILHDARNDEPQPALPAPADLDLGTAHPDDALPQWQVIDDPEDGVDGDDEPPSTGYLYVTGGN